MTKVGVDLVFTGSEPHYFNSNNWIRRTCFSSLSLL